MQDLHNTYTSEYPAIHDVASEEMHNIVLLYSSPNSNEWRAMAFQTSQVVRRTEHIEGLTSIDSGNTLQFGMLQTNGHEYDGGTPGDASNDLLRVDDNKDEKIIEWGLGFDASDVYVGVQNPGDKTVMGGEDNFNRGLDEGDLIDRASVKTSWTLTNNDSIPTTALAPNPGQGLVRFDSDENGRNPMRFGFYNNNSGTETIDVTAYGLAYRITPIESRETVENMVWGKGYNRRVLTYGGYENVSPNLPQTWRRGSISLTSDDAISMVQG